MLRKQNHGFDRVASISPTNTVFHILVKGRERPITYAFDAPVFHWIEVHVIDIFSEITFVANGGFPKSPPNASFAFGGSRFISTFSLRNRAIEANLYCLDPI
jgi:hypothetical protein